MIQILPPLNIRETINDISAGKLNLVVNGEIVNIQVVPTFGEQEDDLVIAIKGFKGNDVFRFPTPGDDYSARSRYGPIRSYFSQFEPFWNWWDTPFEYIPPNMMQATNGDIIVVGTSGTITLTYTAAYAYYNYENERELQAAEEKRLALAQVKVTKPNIKPNRGAEEEEEPAVGKNPVKKEGGKETNDTTASDKQKDGKENAKTNVTSPDAGSRSVSFPATKPKRRLGGLLFWRK